MEALQQQVQDRKENLEGTNSILIQGMSYVPGWSEKNFQVTNPKTQTHHAGSAPRAALHQAHHGTQSIHQELKHCKLLDCSDLTVQTNFFDAALQDGSSI